ncbi:MAG TPA: DUF488 domain-containing protein [Dehalococcoidia bacterium]|nr:DUF488 domain-containing protein [Dehalococcoidia bacterium]
MEDTPNEQSQVFTIGHSNQPLERFLDLLSQKRIAVVVDVRSSPRSAYASQFDRERLPQPLAELAIHYVFLGRELGGRPQGDQYYDGQGRVLYSRVAESDLFDLGIKQLEDAIRRQRVAIMCSEESPAGCHRHLLIARVLTARGILAVHIRADGSLQPEAELTGEKTASGDDGKQLALFEEPQEAAWRSTRSVLPRRPPPSSSGR